MNATPVEQFYQTLPAEMVAERVKENNNTNRYFWMNNKRGRRVPVSHLYVNDALMKGYTHTDNVLQSDDITPKPAVPRVSEKKQLANAMEKIAETLAPVAKTKGKASAVEKEAFKGLTRDQLVTLGLEKGLTQEQLDGCETKQAIIDLF